MASNITAKRIQRQLLWSMDTFGPGIRTRGLIDHINKELQEVVLNPRDLKEWVDIMILAIDGAWRAGYTPQEIIDAYIAKQEENEQRNWPDWTTRSEDEAIEHIR